MLARLHTAVTATLDACDTQTLPPGRLSPRARVLVVYALGALILTLMSFAVLSRDLQEHLATALIDLATSLSPELGAFLRPYHGLLRIAMWSFGAFVAYFALPALVIRRVFGHRLTDYGLNAHGLARHLPLYLALITPVLILVFLVANSPDFQNKYPLYHDFIGLPDLLIWEALYAVQFFSLEFFFRGFLIHGVKDRLGVAGVGAMVMPYVMIHFSKPLYEAIGAILAGTVLGILSLRTRSIAGGVLIHIGVAWTMDCAALMARGHL